LRGEEYSRQIDHFVRRIEQGDIDGENSFKSALETDRVVAMIHGTYAESDSDHPAPMSRWAGLRERLLGRRSA
jgi:hypothetical protein